MSGPARLTHVDDQGRAHMVDVSAKDVTHREAEARCTVRTTADVASVLARNPGGHDLVGMARLAGLQAAKLTSTLIPLCHPLLIGATAVEVVPAVEGLAVRAVATVSDRTGVEMEALTACAVAGLVLVQALLDDDPGASVEDLTLWRKSGGRSGVWKRAPDGSAPPGS